MADDGSREIVTARPARAENPPHPIPRTHASRSDIASVLHSWDADIKRAARHAALARGGSLDDAEDFEQAARLALTHVARSVPGPAEPYLRRTIQNAVRGAARHERRALGALSQAFVELNDNLADPTSEQGGELVALLLEWLSLLPARMQRLYELLYVQGYTQREVAKLLRVSQPRVAQLHSDLLRRGWGELNAMVA